MEKKNTVAIKRMASARSFSRDNYRVNGRHINQEIRTPKGEVAYERLVLFPPDNSSHLSQRNQPPDPIMLRPTNSRAPSKVTNSDGPRPASPPPARVQAPASLDAGLKRLHAPRDIGCKPPHANPPVSRI